MAVTKKTSILLFKHFPTNYFVEIWNICLNASCTYKNEKRFVSLVWGRIPKVDLHFLLQSWGQWRRRGFVDILELQAVWCLSYSCIWRQVCFTRTWDIQQTFLQVRFMAFLCFPNLLLFHLCTFLSTVRMKSYT